MDDHEISREGGNRLTVFWLGARRGLKFGAITCVFIWIILNGVIFGVTRFLPTLREQVLNYLGQHGVLTAMGALLMQLVLMLILGAIPTALIAGLVSVVRSRGAKPMDSDQ